MARADAIVRLYGSLSKEQRELFHLFLALNLLPETTRLKAAATAYLNAPSSGDGRGACAGLRIPAPGTDPAHERGARRDALCSCGCAKRCLQRSTSSRS